MSSNIVLDGAITILRIYDLTFGLPLMTAPHQLHFLGTQSFNTGKRRRQESCGYSEHSVAWPKLLQLYNDLCDIIHDNANME